MMVKFLFSLEPDPSTLNCSDETAYEIVMSIKTGEIDKRIKLIQPFIDYYEIHPMPLRMQIVNRMAKQRLMKWEENRPSREAMNRLCGLKRVEERKLKIQLKETNVE